MSILQQARWVDGRKDGPGTCFRLADADPPELAQQVTELVLQSLGKEAKIRADARHILNTSKIDAKGLCCAQSACR
jgi:hypothetical protein